MKYVQRRPRPRGATQRNNDLATSHVHIKIHFTAIRRHKTHDLYMGCGVMVTFEASVGFFGKVKMVYCSRIHPNSKPLCEL